jgi:hypothetical protein
VSHAILRETPRKSKEIIMTNQPTSDGEGLRIRYDHYEPSDGYVTGIAHVKTAEGQSFEIRVSGPAAAVDQYAAEAVILKLALVPATSESAARMAQLKAQALEFRRTTWYEQREKLSKLIGRDIQIRPEELEQFVVEQLDSEARASLQGRAPDPRLDRIIRIAPEKDTASEAPYYLTFQIHPHVAQGRYDAYAPVEAVSRVWGAVDTYAFAGQAAGDADLNLWRGGGWITGSYSGGTHDEVASDSGSGDWELDVYGYSDTYYDISGDWTPI